jgi:hypothetical protein
MVKPFVMVKSLLINTPFCAVWEGRKSDRELPTGINMKLSPAC